MNSSKTSKTSPRDLTVEELNSLRASLASLEKMTERNRLEAYRPYTKQREFHAAGRDFDERLFMAGNQLGKTLAGAMEWAMHLTGLYPEKGSPGFPDGWQGKRFAQPVRMWAAGVTRESTRDNPQRLLMGPPQQSYLYGT